jgi:hypothetical protein
MLDHALGTLTASSAILVDSNSKVNQLLTGNLRIGTVANRIDTSSGDLILHAASGTIDISAGTKILSIIDNSTTSLLFKAGSETLLTLDTGNGTEKVIFGKQIHVGTEYTLPLTDGSNGQALITNGSGTVAFTTISTDLTVGADTGTDDVVSLITDTLNFTGGEGIDTTVSNNTITIAGENASTSNKGLASFNTSHFTVSSGAVSAQNFTIGSTSLTLGGSSTVIAGVTQLDVDNVRTDGNQISTTDNNGALTLAPHGTATVLVPSGYKDRSGFGTNSLATKEYVDALKQGLDVKDSVIGATTADINLSGHQTIDGIAITTGNRVLVKNQSNGYENGIYVAASGSWARSIDADVSADVTPGMFTFVELGTTNGDSGFVLTTNATITLGTTVLTFTQFSGAGQIVAGDGLEKVANSLHVKDDNITIEINSDAVRLKGIAATAIGDLLIGAASNAGYTRLVKPAANDSFLTMGTNGAAVWATTLDGGTF